MGTYVRLYYTTTPASRKSKQLAAPTKKARKDSPTRRKSAGSAAGERRASGRASGRGWGQLRCKDDDGDVSEGKAGSSSEESAADDDDDDDDEDDVDSVGSPIISTISLRNGPIKNYAEVDSLQRAPLAVIFREVSGAELRREEGRNWVMYQIATNCFLM